ncbi:hypothetical protein BH24ACT19_BH24ACT19_14320 [soil metagenome]
MSSGVGGEAEEVLVGSGMRTASLVRFRVVRASRTVSEAVLLRYVLAKNAKVQGRSPNKGPGRR